MKRKNKQNNIKIGCNKIKVPSKFVFDVVSSSLNAQNIYNFVLSGTEHEHPEALSDIEFVLRFATCNREKI